MTNKLTDKQVDFLDGFMDGINVCITDSANYREEVMDRAEERFIEINNSETNRGWRKIRLHTANNIYVGKGPDRFTALVNALMEAEK